MKEVVTQIPLENLEINAWYLGRGRNSNIGKWDGQYFIVIADCTRWEGSVKNESTYASVKYEPYFTLEEGCFQPFLKIDEGRIVEPISCDELNYAKKMQFNY